MTRRVLLALLGVLLALGALEFVTRRIYIAPWYDRLIEEQERNPREIPRNRYGLRGPDYAYAKPADVRRVFVIGDSFTAGSWVSDEQVFTRLLEGRINATRPIDGVETVEFLNGGVAATLTDDWVALFERVAGPFDPDLLLIVFFLRDGTQLAAKRDFMGPIREEFATRNAASALYQQSFLYRSIRDRWDKDEILARYSQRFRESYFGDAVESAEWRRAQVNLSKLRDLARNASISIGFVVFPMLVYLEEETYPFADICTCLEEFARLAEMPVHSLLPAYRGRRSSELWLSELNQHPNPLGHVIATDSLLPFIVELLQRHEAERAR